MRRYISNATDLSDAAFRAIGRRAACFASASLLHSWDDKGNSVPFTLNVLNLGDTDVEVDETLNPPLSCSAPRGFIRRICYKIVSDLKSNESHKL